MKYQRWFGPILLLCVVVPAQRARADAIIVTQAMKASTIAEIYITEDSVRVELEIGVADVLAFRNLMPDAIYERLGQEPEPFEQRFDRFSSEDWVIRADGTRLEGELVRIVPRPRVKRDEITGEPLPPGDDEVEPVVFAVLAYPLRGRPSTMSIKPPQRKNTNFADANIGFVVYHLGLPVTDFRYLGSEETVDLDWEDAWYSRFRNKNLRRQNDAPLSAFLYVENFEVRKEVIVRPKDLQQWVDLGLAGKDTIYAEDWQLVKQRVAEFLRPKGRVTIDGRTPEPVLDRIHFVRRTLRRTGVIDPPEDLPVISATLGVIFVYPVDSLPQEVSMPWELFKGKIQKVPSVATDEAGGLPYLLTPGDSILTWRNFLTNPSVFGLVDIEPPPSGKIPVPMVSVLCGLLFAAAIVRSIRLPDTRRRSLLAAAVLTVGLTTAWPFARVALPNPLSRASGVSDTRATAIVAGLLTNVYRAFDYRDESLIYDVLSRSASGELLTQVYLETRRALELQNQGGARVKVRGVTMEAVEAEGLKGELGFNARCTWNVAGSVGHWGHIHTRTNRYDAIFTIKSVDGVWKITELELLEEQRVT